MSKVHAKSAGGQSPASSSSSGPSEYKAQFAVRSDTAVLLSTAEMEDKDLTGRTLWTGVVLTQEELGLLRAHAVNQEDDIASKLISRLPKKPISTP